MDSTGHSVETRSRLLRLREVCSRTGLGRSAIYDLESKARFPRRVKITEHAVAWLEQDVNAWINERVKASR
jgi:prophage regulatory protein